MSDLDNKIMKGSELGGSFSDLMKKVVEKQLHEENAHADAAEETDDAAPEISAPGEEAATGAVIEPEEEDSRRIEMPVFEWNKKEKKPAVENYQPVSEVGVISTTTAINGTVSSKGHIRIEGNVIGDIFAYGDIKVTGKIAGDIEGGNIELGGCIVDGDVKARGDVIVGKESTLSGNMNGQLITIDGKIKGDVNAVKGAHMSSTSFVKGSITAPTLSMSAGAELQGRVNVSRDDTE